jgi:hypothetical protein
MAGTSHRSGGARPGAGRPTNPVRALESHFADRIFKDFGGEEKAWSELLQRVIEAKDLKLQFEILQYMTDRKYGRPAQSAEISGVGGAPIQLILDNA